MASTQPVVDDLPFSRPDAMIPGAKEMGIMICEFETRDGANRAAKMALMAYEGPDIGLRVAEPTEERMLNVFERFNNRPYTAQARSAGRVFEPTLETGKGQKVFPRFRIGELAGPEMLVFAGPNELNPKAADGDLWVAGMNGGVIVPKIRV